jgi:hypothetical protein
LKIFAYRQAKLRELFPEERSVATLSESISR